MSDLREQIFRVTDEFLTNIQQLTQRHTALVLQETFGSLGTARASTTAAKSRGNKRAPEELDQLSQRFAQFVHDNPGLRIEQINKQLGTKTAELALPIRKLIASGVVSVKGEKRATTYFAGKNSAESVSDGGSVDEEAAETPAKKSSKKRSRSGKKSSKSKSRRKR